MEKGLPHSPLEERDQARKITGIPCGQIYHFSCNRPRCIQYLMKALGFSPSPPFPGSAVQETSAGGNVGGKKRRNEREEFPLIVSFYPRKGEAQK